MLQKFIDDRNLFEKEIAYATTPNILAMNFTSLITAPFSTFLTCPFLSVFIVGKVVSPLCVDIQLVAGFKS